MKRKVFGVGFHRTGTTSLQTALEELGYEVVGMSDTSWLAYEAGDYGVLRQSADAHDGFRDMPWALMYEWLDETYPDARFVLTRRSTDSWIRSCQAFYRERPHRMFPKIYGFHAFLGNEERAAEVYEAHICDVRRYFADRPGKLLETDFAAGQGWDQLCEFLNEPTPQRPFPHANVGAFTIRQKIKRKLLYWLRPEEYRRRVRDRVA